MRTAVLRQQRPAEHSSRAVVPGDAGRLSYGREVRPEVDGVAVQHVVPVVRGIGYQFQNLGRQFVFQEPRVPLRQIGHYGAVVRRHGEDGDERGTGEYALVDGRNAGAYRRAP